MPAGSIEHPNPQNITPGAVFPALTLYQPWATLLVHGIKHYETRSWRPPASLEPDDLVAIHASLRPVHLEELSDFFLSAYALANGVSLEAVRKSLLALPRGGIIGVSRYLGCIPTAQGTDRCSELHLGDWTPGRYAWEFAKVAPFKGVIPATGRQRLWKWTVPDAR
jgi:hypothetical protein